ncbi:hypothetical protein EUTSA_v10017612mg [Eutrema salsugineum]|uniref:Uncharacterized protein n=1 Tax=Eutrema salsugineum TaxID=72664 RepID=V4M7I9_EUTSA|nr:uncharacterized protein LOC18026425 [Eutrema salsugineum]ESQ52274.1 hypothetical protein EUTSA_v10017612mg [Eutrema salsugineum]
MSDNISFSEHCRSDNIHTVIEHKEIQEMSQAYERSKLDKGVNIHTTRSRGGSLVEEVQDKLKRFKVRTVNILVGGEDEEQK